MGALAPHVYALWAKPFLPAAFGVACHPLVILRNLRPLLSAELMALMVTTPLMPVTLLIRLMGLVGSAKPLISSHSLRRNSRRNWSETHAAQGLQPFKKIFFFFAVFCCFFRHKTAQ
jgi:hypothetical protein